MDFYAISALINAITSLTLGCFVFLRNKKNMTSVTFVLLSLAVFFWSAYYFLWQISTDYASAIFYTKLLSIGSTLIPIFYLHWVFSFLGLNDKKSNFILLFGYSITTVFIIFSFSPLFIRDVEPILSFKFWPKAGILYTAYLVISYIGLFGYGLLQLLRNYHRTSGLKHYQIQYMIIGTIIGFIGGITNFFLWYDILIPPVGNIIISLYVFILFYAMVKYRLMDFQIMARKIFIYFIISIFTYSFFYFLIWFYNSFFGGVFTFGSYAFGLIIAPLFVFTFYNANKVIKSFANKYLFTSLYNYQETINRLTKELTNYIDLNKIIKLITTTINNAMKIDGVNVFLLNTKTLPKEYQLVTINGIKKNNHTFVFKNKKLIKYLAKNKKILVADELEMFSRDSKHVEEKKTLHEFYEYMKDINATICLPLIVNKELIGMIILGLKKSKDPYTKEDLELLTVLSLQASIAIENARQYKQIKEFGKTLKEKIEEQTKDIKQNNKYLKELLDMKSDFLRVISHQLNTPLSIIRGYFSMMKDGDYKPEKALPIIEAGLYRIINTVADYCDAYKLEGEKMETKPTKVNIEEAIENTIKEKIKYIKDKNLKLSIKKPNFKIPIVWCDLEKTTRVLSNLIENAISYTDKGSIELSYGLKKDFLIINIKDTGCGISKSDKEKLFEKFSRGNRAPNIHPDGSGLGLYISKKIIEGNGGEIYYKSNGENKGTTFSFTIPIYKKTIES
ncbi:MAG: ATP-binding protein [Candidatus Paceibacterota bacterium]|jgi:signal transduction histidine kinase|nr:ATP-binding protein [bacterium]